MDLLNNNKKDLRYVKPPEKAQFDFSINPKSNVPKNYRNPKEVDPKTVKLLNF